MRLDAAGQAAVERNLRDLATRPTVFIKISEVMRIVNGKASTDPALYKPLLDHLFDTFGEDKLIFGSDWPNGAAVDNLPAIVQIVRDYFHTKGRHGRREILLEELAGGVSMDPARPWPAATRRLS